LAINIGIKYSGTRIVSKMSGSELSNAFRRARAQTTEGAQPPSGNFQAEYTFTDRELHDVIEFFEVMNTPPNHQSLGGKTTQWTTTSNRQNPVASTSFDVGEYMNLPSSLPSQPAIGTLQFHPRTSPDDDLHDMPQQPHSTLPQNIRQPYSSRQLPVKHEWNDRGEQPNASNVVTPQGNLRELHGRGASGSGNDFSAVTNSGLNTMGRIGVNNGLSTPALDSSRMSGLNTHVDHLLGPGYLCEDELPLKVSHGASEKQRRDRINSMIDQLRLLVPPRGGGAQDPVAMSAADAAMMEGKRSKYLVLAETIQLLRQQQRQIEEKDAELAQLRAWKRQHQQQGGGGRSPHTECALELELLETQNLQIKSNCTSETGNSQTYGEEDSEDESMNMRGAEPAKHLEVSGVVVDMGPNHCYIKITMLDRRGLLSDILNAIATLPLEVKRAAITTSRDGKVTDIFEVILDPGTQLSEEELRNQVLSALFASESVSSGSKRRVLNGVRGSMDISRDISSILEEDEVTTGNRARSVTRNY